MSKINCQVVVSLFSVCIFFFFKPTKCDKILSLLYVTLKMVLFGLRFVSLLFYFFYFWRQNSGCLLQSAFSLSIYWNMVSNTPSPNTITWINLISFSTFFYSFFFHSILFIFFHCIYLCVCVFVCVYFVLMHLKRSKIKIVLLLFTKRSTQKLRKIIKFRHNDCRWRTKSYKQTNEKSRKKLCDVVSLLLSPFQLCPMLFWWLANRVCFLLKTFQSGKSTADKTNWCFYTVRRSTRICWNIFYFHTPYDREPMLILCVANARARTTTALLNAFLFCRFLSVVSFTVGRCCAAAVSMHICVKLSRSPHSTT